MALILSTGIDPILLKTREMILEHSGHGVVSAITESEVRDACRQHIFSVAIVGQALSPALKTRIQRIVRAHCPAARILELYPANSEPVLRHADAWLEVPLENPGELVDRVNALGNDTRRNCAAA